jgi:hypothetical protein
MLDFFVYGCAVASRDTAWESVPLVLHDERLITVRVGWPPHEPEQPRDLVEAVTRPPYEEYKLLLQWGVFFHFVYYIQFKKVTCYPLKMLPNNFVWSSHQFARNSSRVALLCEQLPVRGVLVG